MSDCVLKIKQLEDSVEGVLNRLDQYEMNLVSLEETNERLLQENTSLRMDLEKMQQENQSLKFAEFYQGDRGEVSAIKTRFNHIITKLDQCIEEFSEVS